MAADIVYTVGIDVYAANTQQKIEMPFSISTHILNKCKSCDVGAEDLEVV